MRWWACCWPLSSYVSLQEDLQEIMMERDLDDLVFKVSIHFAAKNVGWYDVRAPIIHFLYVDKCRHITHDNTNKNFEQQVIRNLPHYKASRSSRAFPKESTLAYAIHNLTYRIHCQKGHPNEISNPLLLYNQHCYRPVMSMPVEILSIIHIS